MLHSINAARPETAAESPAQSHLSSPAFKRDGLLVADDLHFGPSMVITGKDTGFDDLLRRE